eukprot:g37179.t1
MLSERLLPGQDPSRVRFRPLRTLAGLLGLACLSIVASGGAGTNFSLFSSGSAKEGDTKAGPAGPWQVVPPPGPSFSAARSKQETSPKIVLGTMEMGRRTCTEPVSKEMVEIFLQTGHKELDTALLYCAGNTEKILGEMPAKLQAQWLMATKANPWAGNSLNKTDIRRQFLESLASLKVDHVNLFYLHAPDYNTPIEETLSEVHQLYKEGKFKRLGLSNFAAWQVAEIYYLCKSKGYPELFPCLRRLNMVFYAFNPLAGGVLTGRHKYEDKHKEPVGRFFDGGGVWSARYRDRFWQKEKFDAVQHIQEVLDGVYGPGAVTTTAASLRWLMHHSALKGSLGDGVIVGASTVDHLTENLAALQSRPLHAKVVEAIEEAWLACKSLCPPYFKSDNINL